MIKHESFAALPGQFAMAKLSPDPLASDLSQTPPPTDSMLSPRTSQYHAAEEENRRLKKMLLGSSQKGVENNWELMTVNKKLAENNSYYQRELEQLSRRIASEQVFTRSGKSTTPEVSPSRRGEDGKNVLIREIIEKDKAIEVLRKEILEMRSRVESRDSDYRIRIRGLEDELYSMKRNVSYSSGLNYETAKPAHSISPIKPRADLGLQYSSSKGEAKPREKDKSAREREAAAEMALLRKKIGQLLDSNEKLSKNLHQFKAENAHLRKQSGEWAAERGLLLTNLQRSEKKVMRLEKEKDELVQPHFSQSLKSEISFKFSNRDSPEKLMFSQEVQRLQSQLQEEQQRTAELTKQCQELEAIRTREKFLEEELLMLRSFEKQHIAVEQQLRAKEDELRIISLERGKLLAENTRLRESATVLKQELQNTTSRREQRRSEQSRDAQLSAESQRLKRQLQQKSDLIRTMKEEIGQFARKLMLIQQGQEERVRTEVVARLKDKDSRIEQLTAQLALSQSEASEARARAALYQDQATAVKNKLASQVTAIKTLVTSQNALRLRLEGQENGQGSAAVVRQLEEEYGEQLRRIEKSWEQLRGRQSGVWSQGYPGQGEMCRASGAYRELEELYIQLEHKAGP